MMRNRAEIKREAKSLIRTGKGSPLVASAIVLLVGTVLDRIVNLVVYGSLSPAVNDLDIMLAIAESGITDPVAAMEMMESMMPAAPSSLTGSFLSILVSLVMTVLIGGYCVFLMGIRQRLKTPYTSLFDGLGVAGKLIWCQILVYVKTFLWTMLFIFPGIVAAYRYRFAFYNLLTDDSLTASQAIALSCEQTRGIKMELFVLDLSFIGWNLLSSFTAGLLNIWLNPYMYLSELAYFEDAQRRLGRAPYGISEGWEGSGDGGTI